MPSSATDKHDVVRARFVDSGKSHVWLSCRWCGRRHTLSARLVPGMVNLPCDQVIVFVEIADGDFERFCAERGMDPVARRRGRKPR